MATSVYKFVSWANATSHGGQFANYYGTVQVHWNYNQASKTITVTGVTYNNDMYWAVGAAMRCSIVWSDGAVSDLANGTYNFSGGNLISTARAAGFITIGSITGVFTAANRSVSHTFSGNSGGFTLYFGSTASTINYGNPASYRALALQSGTNPSVTFNTPPTWDAGGSNFTTTNPDVYKLGSTVKGINWGQGYTWRKLTCTVKYTLDGKEYSYTAYTSDNPPATATWLLDKKTSDQTQKPWETVPDDATVTITWTASTSVGSVAASKTQYCQGQYEVFVIDPTRNNGAPIASDMFVSASAGSKPTSGVRRIWNIAPGEPKYDLLEYVFNNDGTAYVDTGLTLNGNYEFIVEGCTKSNGATVLIDAYSSNTSRTGSIVYNRARPRVDYWWTGVNYAELDTVSVGIELAEKFTLYQSRDGIQVRQGNKVANTPYTGTAATDAVQIRLLGTQRTFSVDYGRLYTAKIFNGGVIIRDFKPARRKADGVVGVLDLVENKFYASSGASQLGAGPVVGTA